MGKDKKMKPGTISTFLGYESKIEGTIEFKGTIRLDGRVKGKISSEEGTVIVGEKAVIDADIKVDTALVMGQVNGTIDAKRKIQVSPPGKVNGDIQAPMISIDPGAIFNGISSMKERSGATGMNRKSVGENPQNVSPK